MPRSDDRLLPQVPRWRCIYIILGFICVGLGARLVVMFCRGGFCVEVPVIVLRVYLGSVTSFWSTFMLGGGG